MRLFQGMTVVYLSSERFTNELINAIRYDRTAEFRARYRTIDLLLIDDIQFISGKERTQEEFFHTFNDLYESRKQIIVSSDCSPKDIPEIEERLRSRFEWGLIADIQPPDFETRVAILKKKAALDRVRLADDVAYLIASRVKSNIRELEGSLTRMIAFCALTGREMSIDLAQEVLSDLWGEEEKVITIEQIQRKVGDFFGVKLSDLKAKNRTKAVAFPRQIAMYLARQLTHASLVRDRPRLRRQGPHDRPARGRQDPGPAPGRPQTTQDRRRTYPGDHAVIHSAPGLLHTPCPRRPRVTTSLLVRHLSRHSLRPHRSTTTTTTKLSFSLLKQQRRFLMEVILDRDAFLKGLQMVQNIVEPRQTLPILANVLLETEERHRARDRHRPRGRRARLDSRPRGRQGRDHGLRAQARRDRQGAPRGGRGAQGRRQRRA